MQSSKAQRLRICRKCSQLERQKTMAFLSVENLKKNFGATEVLKGISFELEKGEVLAIIGSSGSGKTTLLRCLNFLETADEGIISVDGEVLFDGEALKNKQSKRAKTSKELREKRLKFGLVFQNFNLFPHYNVLSNVTIASRLLAKEQLKAEYAQIKKENKSDIKTARALKAQAKANILDSIDKKAMELLSRVGLADKKNAYPCELSGGQCQRVAIARALALSPDVLCFDEPTSALDPELTGEVLRVIRSLKSGDRTMIVVTHEMEFARNVADKVIFMADGVIEEQGTPEQVFDNPTSPKTQAFLQKDALGAF